MAANRNNKRRGKGRQFEPGQSGNPTGRPALTPEEKQYRRLSREQFADVMNKLLAYPRETLLKIAGAPDTPMFMELAIKYLDTMDYKSFDLLLNRLIGKVPDDINLNQVKPFILERRDGSVTVMGAKETDE
jgi:hypothetical protein